MRAVPVMRGERERGVIVQCGCGRVRCVGETREKDAERLNHSHVTLLSSPLLSLTLLSFFLPPYLSAASRLLIARSRFWFPLVAVCSIAAISPLQMSANGSVDLGHVTP